MEINILLHKIRCSGFYKSLPTYAQRAMPLMLLVAVVMLVYLIVEFWAISALLFGILALVEILLLCLPRRRW